MTEQSALTPPLEKVGKAGPAISVVGIIGFAIGLFALGKDHIADNALHFYLYAWIIGLGYTLGCHGMMLAQYAIKGSYGYPVIRMWESGARLTPFMAIIGLPLWFLRARLYHWAQFPLTDETLIHRQAYMNADWVLIRAVIYFAIWIGTTYFLSGISRRLDTDPDVALLRLRTNVASITIPIFILSVNFAYTDWVMSLENHFYSTIFGLWFLVSQAICGVGLVTILTSINKSHEPYATQVDNSVRRDLGNWMLLLVMLWGYFSFSQWVIVWSGNLPDEIEFYLTRFTGLWLYVGAFIVVFNFFGPFLLLLSGKTKRFPVLVAGVASWLLFMRLVDVGWTILPSFGASNPLYLVVGAFAAMVIMGVWLTLFIQQLRGAKLITSVIPERVEEAAEHA